MADTVDLIVQAALECAEAWKRLPDSSSDPWDYQQEYLALEQARDKLYKIIDRYWEEKTDGE